MNSASADLPVSTLHAFLQRRQQDSPSINTLVVAFSAGPDSLALLLATHQVAPFLGYAVRALHVHHGLHADADTWAKVACAQAEALGVKCDVLRVSINNLANIEAQARHARYSALAGQLQANEALLLAHHQDDQAETVLLRLMRGAGLQGLTGMAEVSTWSSQGNYELLRWRPWLSVPKQLLTSWLAAQSKTNSAINDPANSNTRFDRTLLRQQVLPLLQTRWSQASQMLARSVSQLAAQAQALNQLADIWLAGHCADLMSLPISALTTLEVSTQQAVLARWLQRRNAPEMPVRYWPRLFDEFFHARLDANPELIWSDVALRRYRDNIYLLSAEELEPLPSIGANWVDPLRPLSWAGHQWCLPLVQNDPRLAQHWRISARLGGERWQPEGRANSVTLKHWCQENSVPTWQRSRLAVVWCDDEIAFLALIYGKSIIFYK